MPKRSKLIIFVPVVLLLVRNIVPGVHGQLNPVGWSLKSDRVNNQYRLQSALPADRAFQSNPSNLYWSPNLDSFSTIPVRDLVEIPPSPLHTSGIHRQQQLPVDLYSLLKEQRHAPPRNAPTGIELIDPITTKMLFQQQSKKSQDEQKETPAVISGSASGSPIDYPSPDDENSAQQSVQPVGPYIDDYSQPSSPSKAKIKSRQVVQPNGLSRYLVFQNLKRARDGYICHFKLCQVGVSGKRLSNM